MNHIKTPLSPTDPESKTVLPSHPSERVRHSSPVKKLSVVFFAFSVLVITIVTTAAMTRQNLFSKAFETKTRVFFATRNITMTPSEKKPVPLMIEPSAPLAFVKVQIHFDNTVLSLSSDPVPNTQAFGLMIDLPSADIANKTGVITMTVGLGSIPLANAPDKLFKLTDLTFQPIVDVATSTNLTIDTIASQCVSHTAVNQKIAAENLTITFNNPRTMPHVVPIPGESSISTITAKELDQGWYWGSNTQKKPGTPNDWVHIDAGRSSQWRMP